MARPRLYSTEEERRDAKQASWQKYNKAHKAKRAAHNKQYCQREDVKERRRQLRVQHKNESYVAVECVNTVL